MAWLKLTVAPAKGWVCCLQVLGIWSQNKFLSPTVLQPHLQQLKQRLALRAEAEAQAAAAAKTQKGVDEMMQEADIGDVITFR